MIPDELMVNILAHVLDSHEESKKGVIFDGFPRTIAQAEALTRMLAERNAQVDVVLGLEVEEEELIDRLLKRGQVSGRSDDNMETIQKRLDVYHNQTKPLKDFYKKRKNIVLYRVWVVSMIFSNLLSRLYRNYNFLKDR